MVNININGDILEGIELFIFDRDGTLIDLYTYWAWMISKRSDLICRKLSLDREYYMGLESAMGIDAAKGKIKPQGPVGLKKREVVAQAAIDYLNSRGITNVEAVCFEAFQETDAVSVENLQRIVKPLPGLYELFDRLLNKSCRIAIATTDKTQRAKMVMGFLGLAERIDLIIGEDAVSRPKPAADMIEMILNTLKIDRNKAVMVGDAVSDMRMGINANVKACLAVLTGISDREKLKELAHHVMDDINGIKIDEGPAKERSICKRE